MVAAEMRPAGTEATPVRPARVRGLMLALAALAACLAAASASADVRAYASKQQVDANESFQLTVTTDNGEDAEPDLSPLEADFDLLGGRRTSQNMSIVNGRTTVTRTWVWTLLPKRPGEFTIPALAIGQSTTEPIRITVREASKPEPGTADIFLDVSVDRERSWVQAQIVYTLRLYLGVSPRQPVLDDVSVEGGEVLIEQLGDGQRYEEQVGERIYSVIERRFALFPQSSGTFTVPPIRFKASLWDRGRISTPRVYSSEAVTFEVLPVVPPPDEFAGAAWLPAEDLRLSAELEPAGGQVQAGEPAGIEVMLEADGLLASQLPELTVPAPVGLRIYPDQPNLLTRREAQGVTGIRQEKFAVIAANAGDYALRDVRVPWWDVNAARWRVAELSLPTLDVSPSADTVPVVSATTPAAQAASPATPAPATPPPAVAPDELRRWKLISGGLLTLWIVTMLLYWRMGKPKRVPDARRVRDEPLPPFRRAARSLNDALRACRAGDPYKTREALLQWANATWPDARLTSLGQVADRLDDDAAAAFEALNRQLYGPAGEPWDGSAMEAVLKRLNSIGGARAGLRKDRPIAPLMPG